MNILKIIDRFLFGTVEEQNELDRREKLWFYLPVSFGVSIALFVKAVIM